MSKTRRYSIPNIPGLGAPGAPGDAGIQRVVWGTLARWTTG